MGCREKNSMVSIHMLPKETKNDKREHVNENGMRNHKIKKMSVSNASDASVNASHYRNGIGSVTLGLDSHLDSNVINWDCVV